MSFNGNGVFNRLYNWVQDAASGINIRADRMDAEMNGFATGLSTCLTRDGQAGMEADLKMGGFGITNLKDPAANQDAATRKFVTDLTDALANITVSSIDPSSPSDGDLWYRTTGEVGLYVWVANGDSGAWQASRGVLPATPPPSTVSATAPTNPVVGQLWYRTAAPAMLLTWSGTAWIPSAGQPISTQIVTDGSNWQIVGNVLRCWGTTTTLTTGGQPITFPREFGEVPFVSLAVFNGSSNFRVASFNNRNTTGIDISAWDQLNARVAQSVHWAATGLALVGDRRVGTINQALAP